jgi:mRNA-degrading endonuclease RelE of RelBE toxin-antitoxin system
MTWAVLVDPPARRSLEKLRPGDRERILDALRGMQVDPFAGDIRKLRGEHEGYRRRVGPWRIFFEADHAARVVYITGIVRRTSTTY